MRGNLLRLAILGHVALLAAVIVVPASANTFSDPIGTMAHMGLAGSKPSPTPCEIRANRFASNPVRWPMDEACFFNPKNNKWYRETDRVKREAAIAAISGAGHGDGRQVGAASFSGGARVMFRDSEPQ